MESEGVRENSDAYVVFVIQQEEDRRVCGCSRCVCSFRLIDPSSRGLWLGHFQASPGTDWQRAPPGLRIEGLVGTPQTSSSSCIVSAGCRCNQRSTARPGYSFGVDVLKWAVIGSLIHPPIYGFPSHGDEPQQILREARHILLYPTLDPCSPSLVTMCQHQLGNHPRSTSLFPSISFSLLHLQSHQSYLIPRFYQTNSTQHVYLYIHLSLPLRQSNSFRIPNSGPSIPSPGSADSPPDLQSPYLPTRSLQSRSHVANPHLRHQTRRLPIPPRTAILRPGPPVYHQLPYLRALLSRIPTGVPDRARQEAPRPQINHSVLAITCRYNILQQR